MVEVSGTQRATRRHGHLPVVGDAARRGQWFDHAPSCASSSIIKPLGSENATTRQFGLVSRRPGSFFSLLVASRKAPPASIWHRAIAGDGLDYLRGASSYLGVPIHLELRLHLIEIGEGFDPRLCRQLVEREE